MHKVYLENCRFFAYHGVHEEEEVIGGEFSIDLCLTTDFYEAKDKDILSGTIDYSRVYAVLKEEMAIPSRLIEHVSGRILKRLFSDFSELKEVKLKLCKINPPIQGEIGSVCIEIQERR